MSKVNVHDKLMMPEFNIDTVYDSQGRPIPGIKRMFDIAHRIGDSIMQWGAPGIGKSQGVLQWNESKVQQIAAIIAKEIEDNVPEEKRTKPWNPVVCDVRLSMKEPVDMVGVPIPTKIASTDADGNILKDKDGNTIMKTVTIWATPSMWPEDNGQYSGGTIHLDEINQGQAAILNAAFQLIQDKALGEYKVPKGYIIIASANPSAYNSTVCEFSVPLSNRFSHFNIKPDFDAWLDYRMNNGGNLDVMTFLKTQGMNMLFDRVGMEKQVGSLSDAMFTDIVITPRSWEVIEKLLALPENEFSVHEKQMYASGRLGAGLASRFFTYLKDKAKYQDWREILEQGKDFRDEESEQFWAVQMACMSAIINQKDDAVCRKYVLNFINATRNLKSGPYKVINVTQITRCKRLEGAMHIFNPMSDAKDMIKLAAISFKN